MPQTSWTGSISRDAPRRGGISAGGPGEGQRLSSGLHLTMACKRCLTAYAPAPLRLPAAPNAQRSASIHLGMGDIHEEVPYDIHQSAVSGRNGLARSTS